MRGRTIAMEGIDGSGKNTQSTMLKEYMENVGFYVKRYSYPDYSSEYGQIIRNFLAGKLQKSVDELFFLYLADMIKDKPEIEIAISAGAVVTLDRWFATTVAYQSAGGFGYERAKAIQEAAGLPKPDLALYFNAEVHSLGLRKERQKAAEGSEKDRFERDAKYLEDVDSVYKIMIAENYGANKWAVIDAMKSKEEVHKDVIAIVSPLLR